MKKIFIPTLLTLVLPLLFSCSSILSGYRLNENDAAAAVRQLLQLGASESSLAGSFSKDAIMTTIFPEPVKKVLTTLNTLGLTSEVDRFTTTLSMAAEKTAAASVPVFTRSINNMKFNDAMRIIKSGGTSATDYLRTSAGDSLRRSITPIMQAALDEYKLNAQWEQLIKPVKGIAGNRLNLDMANLMAGLVSEAMFRKMAEKEIEVRNNASARTTTLLQKVFSRNWS
ncbi:DUF4197 domain-containing protein [Chitinophagaceae bacterium LB-8]|uniref:DUF4197 domain-containing protein n=1 Tax=Paraflavisolibacter caeni TaxID=2982496 RepID=A0A9X3BGD2_9BACT|nr:DUF4197 domain-containing protein [Paraflavisolibacter caeni]MCU7547567.1 DUF4197 domain-containing protein [Paraflavisolibacter caeni]